MSTASNGRTSAQPPTAVASNGQQAGAAVGNLAMPAAASSKQFKAAKVQDDVFAYLDRAQALAKKARKKKQITDENFEKPPAGAGKKAAARTAKNSTSRGSQQQQLPKTRSGRARLPPITKGSPASTQDYYSRKESLKEQAAAALDTRQQQLDLTDGAKPTGIAAAAQQQAASDCRSLKGLSNAWAALKAGKAAVVSPSPQSADTVPATAVDQQTGSLSAAWAAARAANGGAAAAQPVLAGPAVATAEVGAVQPLSLLQQSSPCMVADTQVQLPPGYDPKDPEVMSAAMEALLADDHDVLGASEDEGEEKGSDSQGLDDGAAVENVVDENSYEDDSDDEGDEDEYETDDFDGDSE